MFELTSDDVAFVRRSMFADGAPSSAVDFLRWEGDVVAGFLRPYRRRDYKTREFPTIDRALYAVEYHSGEGSTCTRQAVVHDGAVNFVLTYGEGFFGQVPIGVIGFDVSSDTRGSVVLVSQIQGAEYVRPHSGLPTGAEGPAKSLCWQPALLNLVVAFSAVAGAGEVGVVPHHRNRYERLRHNIRGNAHRLYDGTAESCGFRYDPNRELWLREAPPMPERKASNTLYAATPAT